MTAMHEIFGEPIHTYTRAQAIGDGYLVDVSAVAAEAGIRYPTAMTRAAWADMVEWSREDNARKGTLQDEAGRLWDVLWMLRCAIAQGGGKNADGEIWYRLHRVPRAGRGRLPRSVVLRAVCGPGDEAEPVITIMLPDEG